MPHFTRRVRSLCILLLAAALLAGAAGCTGAPALETTAVVPPAASATPAPASPATAPAAPTTTSEAPVETPPDDAPTEIPAGENPPPVQSDNLFATILGPVSAPEGWTVSPCEGAGPFLCVLQEQEVVGTVELTLYAIDTLPDFQGILAEAGVEHGSVDFSDPARRAGLLDALQTFVANYHTSIETDRQVEYGDEVSYERLETEEVQVGSLPGLRYGFAGVDATGNVSERWVSFVAFDGTLMYILVAHYRPDSFNTFRSDADLQRFLPHLAPVVAGLALPLPVLETDVQSVRALRDLDIFRAYGDAGNPIGRIAAGETVQVTGMSPNRRHWRIACPNGVNGNCWIAASPDATDPAP